MLTFGLYVATFLIFTNVLGMVYGLIRADRKMEQRIASLLILVLQVFALIYLFNQIAANWG